MIKNARIGLGPAGTGTLELDGVDVAKHVLGLQLTAKPGHRSELQLTLQLLEFEVDGEAHVLVPDDVRATLIELGWTPPAVQE